MPDGIQVDPEALRAAAGGTRQSMDALPQGRLATMHSDPEAVGDAEFASTLTNFCVRWRAGLKYMIADGYEVAKRLDGSAQEYEDNESVLDKMFRKVGDWLP